MFKQRGEFEAISEGDHSFGNILVLHLNEEMETTYICSRLCYIIISMVQVNENVYKQIYYFIIRHFGLS